MMCINQVGPTLEKIMHQPVTYTGYTQKNGAVTIVKTIETAPFFCVYPVYMTFSVKKF